MIAEMTSTTAAYERVFKGWVTHGRTAEFCGTYPDHIGTKARAIKRYAAEAGIEDPLSGYDVRSGLRAGINWYELADKINAFLLELARQRGWTTSLRAGL